MYCIHCGTELSDDSLCCPNCGQQKTDSPNVDIVMSTGRSPFTLAFTIAFSVQILFSLIYSNLQFFSVTELILETVICAGCWMVYVNSCKNIASPAGFSVLRIGVPVYLAFSVLEMIASAVVSPVFYSNIIIESVMIIVYLTVFVLRVWCYFKLCVITNHGCEIMNGVSSEWKVSGPLFAVMTILTVLRIIGEIAGFGNYDSAAATVSFLACIVTSVLAVVILFQIRQKYKRLF